MPTTVVNLTDLKDEFLNFIRWKTNSLDDKSRTTETTETFDGNDSDTDFVLGQSTTLRYVKSVSIGGTPQTFGTDYTFIFPGPERTGTTGAILFTVAPPTGTDNISVTYGYNKTMTYTDFPKVQLGADQYPRMAITATKTSVPGGMQGGTQNVNKSIIRFSILIFSESVNQIDSLEATITDEVLKNAKNFFNFKWIQPESVRENIPSEDRTADVIGKNMDFLVTNRYEIVSYE